MLLILSPIVPSGGLIDDALTNVYIISQKKTPAKRGRILVLSDLCEDPNKKIDIDAIEHAPRVYSISSFTFMYIKKDLHIVEVFWVFRL